MRKENSKTSVGVCGIEPQSSRPTLSSITTISRPNEKRGKKLRPVLILTERAIFSQRWRKHHLNQRGRVWHRTTINTAYSLIHHNNIPSKRKWKGERNRACSYSDGASNLLPTMEKQHMNQRRACVESTLTKMGRNRTCSSWLSHPRDTSNPAPLSSQSDKRERERGRVTANKP